MQHIGSSQLKIQGKKTTGNFFIVFLFFIFSSGTFRNWDLNKYKEETVKKIDHMCRGVESVTLYYRYFDENIKSIVLDILFRDNVRFSKTAQLQAENFCCQMRRPLAMVLKFFEVFSDLETGLRMPCS